LFDVISPFPPLGLFPRSLVPRNALFFPGLFFYYYALGSPLVCPQLRPSFPLDPPFQSVESPSCQNADASLEFGLRSQSLFLWEMHAAFYSWLKFSRCQISFVAPLFPEGASFRCPLLCRLLILPFPTTFLYLDSPPLFLSIL